MRLFLAILLNAPVRQALTGMQKEWSAFGVTGRFSRPEQLHLTLAFLGEQAPSVLPAVKDCMKAAVQGIPSPAVLSFLEIGRFRRREGDLYYLGVDSSPWLLQLQTQLTHALDNAGISYDKKPFRPHLTLGRNVKVPSGTALPSDRSAVPDMPVSAITLMESHRCSGILMYTPRYQIWFP